MKEKPSASVKFGVQLKTTVPRPSFLAASSSAHRASAVPANLTTQVSSRPSPLRRLGIASPCQLCGPSSQRPLPPLDRPKSNVRPWTR